MRTIESSISFLQGHKPLQMKFIILVGAAGGLVFTPAPIPPR